MSEPMENVTSDQQTQLISSFLEIAVGQTVEIASQFLKAGSWKLEEAINLFLIARRNPNPALLYQEKQIPLYLPSKMDTLCDSSMHHIPDVTVSPSDIWNSIQEQSDSKLSSMYRPPLNLLFNGSFEDAKTNSSRQDLWLLVNLQSTTEFASHMLNRDLWSNDAVSQAITSSFILWQVYDHTNEGKKISTFYKIDSDLPVVLLIDPITGQKIRSWSGAVEAQTFLEDLMKYIDAGPHEHIASLTSNKRIKTEKICFPSNNVDDDRDMTTFWDDDVEESEDSYKKEETFSSDALSCSQEFEETMILPNHDEETCSSSDLFEFPVLTEEPKADCDQSVVCSLCIRYPDGKRKQRKFLKSEPIQLLWSFCYSHMEAPSDKKTFKLVQAIPGAVKTLDYGVNATFDQSWLANSIISVTWE